MRRRTLPPRSVSFPLVGVLQHGWRHANHARGGKKEREYPAERHPVDVADELEEGRQRLRSLFGPRVLPVFVPPWNLLRLTGSYRFG